MENIKGKVALVTGAGKGIGKSAAIALAKEGVHVGMIARTQTDLERVAEELKQYNIKTAIAVADVSNIDSVNNAVASIQKELGFIDILINNAGTGRFGKFLDLTPAEWENVIKVNLLGAYYVIYAVLPAMIEKQTGDIINIASTAGLRGAAVTSAYSASKFGLLGMSESLMYEVRKHNIRVTAFSPSTVATEMAKSLNLTDGNPEKVMQPEDLAEIIIAQLKLNRRIFIKDTSMWSTNP